MNKIELTKCRAGFYYYFTATAQYILKKEGNRWALYNAVQGAIQGDAIATSRCLGNLKGMLAEHLYHLEVTESHNQDKPTVTSEIEPVDFEIDSDLLNSEQNDHSSEQNDQDLANEAIKAVIQAGEEYLKHLIANENSEQNEPDGDEWEWSDFHNAYVNIHTGIVWGCNESCCSQENEPDGDDLHYPPEIDSPDPDFDHDSPEVDYPDYQLLLDKFKEENPHFTILESKFFTVPYWHLKESKVMIFGYGGDGDRWGIFSVISFTKNRTNHIFDGCYEQSRLIYREYCNDVGKFSFAPEPPKNPILEAYKQELTPQGFLFTRKQLALF